MRLLARLDIARCVNSRFGGLVARAPSAGVVHAARGSKAAADFTAKT